MLNVVGRIGAIVALTGINLAGLPIAPAAADNFYSEFPDDLSAECRAAIADTYNTLESRHRVTFHYAAIDRLPDEHPYFPMVYFLPEPEEALANKRVDRLFLGLSGNPTMEIAEGDLVVQSTALNLLSSPQLLTNYTSDLISGCETLALVAFALTDRQQREFGVGEAALVEYRCLDLPQASAVPCWDFDGGAGSPGEVRSY